MAAYTTTRFLDSIKRKAAMPANANTFSNSEILAIADEVFHEKVMAVIWPVLHERWVKIYDQDLVANQENYPLAPRALNQNLRELKLIDGQVLRNLYQVEVDNIISDVSRNPTSFYLRGDEVILYPTPSSSGFTLRQYFYCRPGDLVETSAAAVITAKTSTTVTVSSIPSTWVTGNTFDFVSRQPGHPYREISQVSTDITGSVITFSSIPSGVEVGDYVSLEGETPVIQLPESFIPGFSLAVSAALLTYMSQPGAEDLEKAAMGSLKGAAKVITTRVKNEAVTLITRNPWR